MESEIAWQTDQNGMLTGARIHDSRLVSLAVIDELQMELKFRRLSGDLVMVALNGLHEFNLLQIWHGAIVSEVFVWQVGSVPDAAWDVPDSAWNVLFAERLRSPDKRLAVEKIVRAHPRAFLVQLACSYGGNVAAVCESVRAFEISPPAGS
jgi:hypothetical protein